MVKNNTTKTFRMTFVSLTNINNHMWVISRSAPDEVTAHHKQHMFVCGNVVNVFQTNYYFIDKCTEQAQISLVNYYYNSVSAD